MRWKTILLSTFVLFCFSFQLVSAQNSTSGTQHHQFSLRLAAGEAQEMTAPFVFRAFALDQVEGLEVRFWQEGQWTAWQALRRAEPELAASELLFLAVSQRFSVRSDMDREITATVMNLAEEPVRVVQNDALVLDARINSNAPFKIISRREWGADESLGTYIPKETQAGDSSSTGEKSSVNICAPLEKAYPGQYQVADKLVAFDELGRPLIWPRQYSNRIKKIVVHHTAQTLKDLNDDRRIDARDYKLAVNAIYVYHTLSNGWGDLGYHYLVDPDGNIYEGRAGGPEVIAAHVLCQNSNTIGISVMGNFEDQQISPKAFEGLSNITTYLASLYDINPLGKSSFRGTVLPNIVTHAEVGAVTKQFIGQGATQCPGSDLKLSMDRLRTVVAQGGVKPEYRYEVVSQPRNLRVDPLQSFSIALRIKNTGSQSWNGLKVFSRGNKEPLLTLSTFISSGQEVDLSIPYQAEFEAGLRQELLSFEAGGSSLRNDFKLSYRVNAPVYRYQLLSFTGNTDPLLVGETRMMEMKLKNVSNFPWLNEGRNAVQIREVRATGSEVVSAVNGLQLFLSQSVPVGSEVTLRFELPAQRRAGEIDLQLLPMMGRDRGLKGSPLQVKLPVELPVFDAKLVAVRGQSVQKGFEQAVEFQLVNTGNFAWEPGSVWYQLKGGQKITVSDAVGIGQSVSFSTLVRAGYDDRQMMVSGAIGIDRLPAFLNTRSLRQNRVSFTQTLTARGTVRLLSEVVEVGTLPSVVGVHPVRVLLKNTGNVPWYAEGDDRAVLMVKDRADFLHRSWEKRTTAGFLESSTVDPGEIGVFVLTMEIKNIPRRTTFDEFVLVAGGKEVRTKGKVKVGIVIEGTRELRERSAEGSGQLAEDSGQLMEGEEGSALQTKVAPSEMTKSHELPPVRVWLSDVDQPELEITSPGDFIVWDSATVQVRSLKSGQVFTVGEADVKNGTVFRFRAQGEPYLELKNWGLPKQFGTKKYLDNTFRNVLEVRWEAASPTPSPLQGENPSSASGKMMVINELSLEDYMKGIAEVPETDDQPQEKRKTIAVLARSYALHYLISGYEKFPGKPYNAANSPAIFQKYLGYGFEQRAPKWQEALEATFGEVVLVQSSKLTNQNPKDRVLRAAYFSCTDGSRTKSWDEVWPTNEYFQRFGEVFQSVEDPYGDDPTREGLTACGHQVGLSGYGATQMAKAGAGYREIIQTYYQYVLVQSYEP
ncbi:MAG: N-acetylmuramoyl-L-alanine amidase [Candidatus Altimarinota bacterium]